MGCPYPKPYLKLDKFITIESQRPRIKTNQANFHMFKFEIQNFSRQSVRKLDPNFNQDLVADESQIIPIRSSVLTEIVIFQRNNQVITKADIIEQVVGGEIKSKILSIQQKKAKQNLPQQTQYLIFKQPQGSTATLKLLLKIVIQTLIYLDTTEEVHPNFKLCIYLDWANFKQLLTQREWKRQIQQIYAQNTSLG